MKHLSPHKLLVTLHFRTPNLQSRFLLRNEVIRNRAFYQTLEITNIGTEVFPGGSIKSMMLSDLEGRGLSKSLTIREGQKHWNLRALAPEEKDQLGEFHGRLEWEGVTHVEMTFEAVDKGEIQFYDQRSGPPLRSWFQNIFVVNRENLAMISLLEKLVSQNQARET